MPTPVAVFLSSFSLSSPSSPSLANTAVLEVWYRNRCSQPIWHRMSRNYQLCTQKFPPVFSLDTHLFSIVLSVSIPLLRGFQPGIASPPFFSGIPQICMFFSVLVPAQTGAQQSSAHPLTLILPAASLMHQSWLTYQHTDAKGGWNCMGGQILCQAVPPLA